MTRANWSLIAPDDVPTITMHRLLVIEWLGDGDEKTGQELVRQLLLKAPDLPVELMICDGKRDVLAAMAKAANDVPTLGVPILHIEAHGYAPFSFLEEALGFWGPNRNSGGSEALLWSELEDSLRVLNVATRYNLMIVAAACLSETVLFTTRSDRPLPFMVAVSFRTKVAWSRLERATVAFYEAFLVEDLSFGESFECAVRQLSSAELLGFTSMLRLVLNVVRDVIDVRGTKAHFDDLYLRRFVFQRVNGLSVDSRLEALRHFDASIAPAIDRAVATLLAYDLIPENRARFGIDANYYARQAVRNRRWSV